MGITEPTSMEMMDPWMQPVLAQHAILVFNDRSPPLQECPGQHMCKKAGTLPRTLNGSILSLLPLLSTFLFFVLDDDEEDELGMMELVGTNTDCAIILSLTYTPRSGNVWYCKTSSISVARIISDHRYPGILFLMLLVTMQPFS
jgi:hypothetical protein